MEDHIAELRQGIQAQEARIKELETEQSQMWRNMDQLGRDLSELRIKRELMKLSDMRTQLNQAVASQYELEKSERMIPFGRRPYDITKIESLQSRLAVPLSHEDVSTRQAGRGSEVVYIETFKALEKAQEIFGFEMGMEIRSEPSVLYQMNNKIVMKAIVRVTLANGCYHEDVGIGVSQLSDMADAIRMASKAAVSDSIKRTLQHFGPALGSCLRDKEWVSTDLTPAIRGQNSASKAKARIHTNENFDASKRSRTMPSSYPSIPNYDSSKSGTVSTFNAGPLVINNNNQENMAGAINPPTHISVQPSAAGNPPSNTPAPQPYVPPISNQLQPQQALPVLHVEEDDGELARIYDQIMQQYDAASNSKVAT